MEENETITGEQTPNEEERQATPAEIMQSMKAEYEGKLAEKDNKMREMEARHAAEIRDILTGRNAAVNKQMELSDRVKTAAKQIQKNLGTYKEENKNA